jgi:hypothetical protein
MLNKLKIRDENIKWVEKLHLLCHITKITLCNVECDAFLQELRSFDDIIKLNIALWILKLRKF